MGHEMRSWLGKASFLFGAATLMGSLLLTARGLEADAANGSYVNDCCGKLVLRDGRIVLGERNSVAFRLGKDEKGPYALPATYVGTWEERGFEVDGGRAPMKLRLDALPRPSRIELPAAKGWRSFKRKAPRPLGISG
jgi:hypothetical protein